MRGEEEVRVATGALGRLVQTPRLGSPVIACPEEALARAEATAAEARARADELARQLRERGGDVVERGKGMMSDVVERGKEAVDAVRRTSRGSDTGTTDTTV